MLISPVTDDDSGQKEVRGEHVDTADHSHEYQTASDLFELMASSHLNRQDEENENLSTQDLVLIYKNIDLGAKLISNANEYKRKAPNQYVETIIYEDFDSDTDLSEICSTEDIHNVMLINQERINLLTTSDFDSAIFNRLGVIDPCYSDMAVDYDRHFLYDNLYKKDQIKLNLNKRVLPVSLLDYIRCKHYEDNYNFDMDNIVIHINHTIDQLRRISDGDYLTEKVKEKWKKADTNDRNEKSEITEAKALANTTSVPLFVKQTSAGKMTKRDVLLHSSVDLISITKMLEKTVIVEVPKTLCGSYGFFGKYCNDNLIIKRLKALPETEAKKTSQESRVDVVLQINCSESGQVMSNMNTIVVLKSEKPTGLLPLLTYDNIENCDSPEEKVTEIVHDDENAFNIYPNKLKMSLENTKSFTDSPLSQPGCSEITFSDYDSLVPADSGYQTSGSVLNNEERYKKLSSDTESSIKHLSTDELRLTIQRLNMSALPEESVEDSSSKKRSPTRNRIKSPYENKSHLLDEKKRKKLLEVKQRREKNKLALSVSGYKVKKIKYPVPPQTASSVTKLSISNKSFYNSIYGQSADMELKLSKTKIRKETRNSIPEVPSDTNLATPILLSEGSPLGVDRSQTQYNNKSNYLDNAVTQVMNTDTQKTEQQDNISLSTNKDMKVDLALLSNLVSPSVDGLTVPDKTPENNCPSNFNNVNNKTKREMEKPSTPLSLDPTSTPNNSPLGTITTTSEKEFDEKGLRKENASEDFIKSIDKIYELIHKLAKAECNDTNKLSKSKFTAVAERAPYNDMAGETSTAQYSDSGTSVKHQLTSSNPSSFSFEKAPRVEETPRTDSNSDSLSPKKRNIIPVVSKVIISAKSQNFKTNSEKSIKDTSRNSLSNRRNSTENPLVAISKLLQDFDNVQKNRKKIVTERAPRKLEVTFADTKTESRVFVNKSPKMDLRVDKQSKNVARDGRYKPPITIQQPKHAEIIPEPRNPKNKLLDIDDEIKEARGEAVRGPCKLNARLNSLAQPKKIYVQAQIEEFQARYGKSIVTDRLQKLSGIPSGQSIDHTRPAAAKPKKRKDSTEVPAKHTPISHSSALEKPLKKSFLNRRETVLIPNDQSSNQLNVDTRDVLKKKLAAFSLQSSDRFSLRKNDKESSISFRTGNKEFPVKDKEIVNGIYKSRAPYIPKDLELGSIVSSVEESSAIQGNIHNMINLIIDNTRHDDITDSITIEDSATEHNSRRYLLQHPLIDECERNIGDSIPEQNDPPEAIIIPVVGLENALYQQVSVGSFQKKINHANLKLTPKNSLQKVLLLQSGDSNSVVMQPKISQNIKFMKLKSQTDCLPILDNLDWSFGKFPMQLPIVAYSFPKYKVNNSNARPASPTQFYRQDSRTNKTTQCYKGTHIAQFPEQAPRIDIKEFSNLSTLFKISSTAIKEEEPEELTVLNETTELIENEHVKKTENKNKSTNVDEMASNLTRLDEKTKISKDINTTEPSVIVRKENVANKSGECDLNSPKECDTLTSGEHNIAPRTGITTQEQYKCDIDSREWNIDAQEAGDFGISREQSNMDAIQTRDTTTTRECDKIEPEGDKTPMKECDKKASEECIKHVSPMTSNTDTSSLDILVGLLNEIQRITSSQNQIATSDNNGADVQNKDVVTIIESSAAVKNEEKEVHNVISITSLDKLRHLESHASVLSFYLSNLDDRDIIDNSIANLNFTPLYADKEVSAMMPLNFVSECTSVPSQFFPITVNHSTNVSNSLIGVLSEPSSHSLLSFTENPLRSYKSLTCLTKLIKLPKIDTENEIDQPPLLIVKRPEQNGVRKQSSKKTEQVNADKQFAICKRSIAKKYAVESNLDPIMKMKRDILVTVYSVLVFTVFAALSFPEMLYRA